MHVNKKKKQPKPLLKELYNREIGSTALWVLVAVIKIRYATPDDFFAFIIGVIDLGWAVCSVTRANKVLTAYAGMVEKYRKYIVPIVFNLFFQYIFAGITGIVPVVYDGMTRLYVLDHKKEFEKLEDKASPKDK